jgi:hypothetical protein
MCKGKIQTGRKLQVILFVPLGGLLRTQRNPTGRKRVAELPPLATIYLDWMLGLHRTRSLSGIDFAEIG